jgi:hypothetical protein
VNIRIAVGCALVVFFLSVAMIIAFGMAQPAKAAGPTELSQVKRDLSPDPVAVAPSDVVPDNPVQQPAEQTAQSAPQQQPAQVQPTQQVAPQPPPAQPVYYYRRVTRAS